MTCLHSNRKRKSLNESHSASKKPCTSNDGSSDGRSDSPNFIVIDDDSADEFYTAPCTQTSSKSLPESNDAVTDDIEKDEHCLITGSPVVKKAKLLTDNGCNKSDVDILLLDEKTVKSAQLKLTTSQSSNVSDSLAEKGTCSTLSSNKPLENKIESLDLILDSVLFSQKEKDNVDPQNRNTKENYYNNLSKSQVKMENNITKSKTRKVKDSSERYYE